jgi:Uma2 family endonuclease
MSIVRSRPRHQRVTGVTYDAYVRMRDDPGNRGMRMAYHDGVLLLMSPNLVHDEGARLLLYVVTAYCKEFKVPLRPTGSTTIRHGAPGELKGDGKEPDEGFYVGGDVATMAAKTSIDLDVDPPPSLWVEVDNWGDSASGLPIYAQLKVPEVWRYRVRARTLWFGRRAGPTYRKIASSEALPGLVPAAVLDLLDEYRATNDVTAWNSWMEHTWFPEHRQELLAAGAGAGR